jgi:uncharacterized protein (DUF58 family)
MNLASPLTPERVEASASSRSRVGFAFGSRFFLLLVCGLVWMGPAFLDARFLYGILIWDVLLLTAWAYDLSRLPRPQQLSLARQWEAPAALSVQSTVTLLLNNGGGAGLYAEIVDDVPPALRAEVPQIELTAPPRQIGSATYSIIPAERGDSQVEDAYVRYQSLWRVAERWTRVPLRQIVRVYPNIEEAKRHAFYMTRSRQIEVDKRYARLKGAGREFESLREYRDGDELRNICWSATARRGKLVSKTFQVERSQAIWLVVDCGRLMRARVGSISKLDAAVNTALTLSEAMLLAGDRVGLLAYGRNIQKRILPGRGSYHLRQMMEGLVDVHEEAGEADHLRALGVLLSSQKRRSLVVWLTDLSETAMTPEVVDSAMRLMPQHLVLLAVIGQPDLAKAASRDPENAEAMFQAAAAQEVMHRRELVLARLREHGALALDVDSAVLSSTLIAAYLDVKLRNQL